MGSKAAITVNRPREELQRLWSGSEHRPQYDAEVSFRDAPGDRGTEIHVDTEAEPLDRVKEDLRRFKRHVETGEIPRSDEATN